jgi:hypothetical protein
MINYKDTYILGEIKLYDIWGSHNGEDTHCGLLACDAVEQGWTNFFVGGPNEKSKMSGGPT